VVCMVGYEGLLSAPSGQRTATGRPARAKACCWPHARWRWSHASGSGARRSEHAWSAEQSRPSHWDPSSALRLESESALEATAARTASGSHPCHRRVTKCADRIGPAGQHTGAMLGCMTPPKTSAAENLPEALRPLVQQLAALPATEREQVIRAVREDSAAQSLPVVPWEEFKQLCGIISLGGDAVEDTEALYDDV
jgi:hypothetical protein